MRVSAKALARLAGLIWLGVGLMLIARGVLMLRTAAAEPESRSMWMLALSAGCGLVLGAIKGNFVLVRSARRNMRRIDALEEPRAWNVFSARFAVLIGLMIAAGVGLRALAEHGYIGGYLVVGGLYVGIGAALCASSLACFRGLPPEYFAPKGDGPPERSDGRIGVLLVNLGTPDEPTPGAVRRYLREFLGDPRVIEVPRPIWAFVLNCIILPLRSSKSAAAYREIWSPDGSPLLAFTQRAAEAVQRELGDQYVVTLGMRYGNPSLKGALQPHFDAQREALTVVPLFPQYSNTTYGTVQTEVARLVSHERLQPALHFVPPYYERCDYIAAVADLVRRDLERHEIDHVVFSFHSLPAEYVLKGDPYPTQCRQTAWDLATTLRLEPERWSLAYQSRFGDNPWVQPYLDEYVEGLATTHRRLLVVTPGFSADCLETLAELGLQLRESFLAAGGEEIHFTPAVNADPTWVRALASLIRESAPTPTRAD